MHTTTNLPQQQGFTAHTWSTSYNTMNANDNTILCKAKLVTKVNNFKSHMVDVY